MKLPISGSWSKARYIVRTVDNEELVLCRFHKKDKVFKKNTQYRSVGEGTWWEWTTIPDVVSWVRVDNLV